MHSDRFSACISMCIYFVCDFGASNENPLQSIRWMIKVVVCIKNSERTRATSEKESEMSIWHTTCDSTDSKVKLKLTEL